MKEYSAETDPQSLDLEQLQKEKQRQLRSQIYNSTLEATSDLIPLLMERAINSKTKDMLSIFESFADRSGFIRKQDELKLTQANNPNLPQINLTINTPEMLSTLQTITQDPIKIEDHTNKD